MARYPAAEWHPISGSAGAYTGGPPKIVHHTTEGDSLAGALAAYEANRSDPHFTVSETRVLQHIDCSVAARSLRNARGGVETNRDFAIQIEVVGRAAFAKSGKTLDKVARLCRWIEETYDIPPAWPSGPPKPATETGRDPGGHNRNAHNWNNVSGHYGHCHVPENTHWDPAYTPAELEIVMGAHRTPPSPTPTVISQPTHVGPIEELDMNIRSLTYMVTTDSNGNGNTTVPHRLDDIISFVPAGIRPNVDRKYLTADVGFAPDGANGELTVISVEEWAPGFDVPVYLRVRA